MRTLQKLPKWIKDAKFSVREDKEGNTIVECGVKLTSQKRISKWEKEAYNLDVVFEMKEAMKWELAQMVYGNETGELMHAINDLLMNSTPHYTPEAWDGFRNAEARIYRAARFVPKDQLGHNSVKI